MYGSKSGQKAYKLRYVPYNKKCHFFSYYIDTSGLSNISKTSARFSSGFQTRETFKTTRPQAKWFYCFRVFGNLMKPEAQIFEISSPTKKVV